MAGEGETSVDLPASAALDDEVVDETCEGVAASGACINCHASFESAATSSSTLHVRT